MKILALSNGYPPHHVGGYEIGCRDVLEALRSRGHDVRVLVSTVGASGRPRADGHVHRLLTLDGRYHARTWRSRLARPFRVVPLLRKELTNQRVMRDALRSFTPDLLYIWNPGGVSMSAAVQANAVGIPVAYFVSDHWMKRFPREELWFELMAGHFAPAALRGPARRAFQSVARRMGLVIGDATLLFRNVQFASRFLLDEVVESGKRVVDATVIHWGIDAERFHDAPREAGSAKRLLFVGTLVPHKGVQTAIAAIAAVRRDPAHADVTLDVVGGHAPPGFEESLRAQCRELGVENAVRFRGLVSRDDLAELYLEHDILVFASIWPEPFSITVLEALASGLAVVGTTTGGSGEILEHGRNALTFVADDPADCARQITALLAGPALLEAIRAEGRRTVVERFTFSGMVEAIEAALVRAVAAHAGDEGVDRHDLSAGNGPGGARDRASTSSAAQGAS